ncbi:MAG TPA: SPOR domain-containing protein [Thermodesulfobacteriota bacterium]
MTPRARLAAVLAAVPLLLGAEWRDGTLDLTVPQPFPIEGDVPVLPPPVAPPPEPSPEAATAPPSALPGQPSASPAASLPAASPVPSPAPEAPVAAAPGVPPGPGGPVTFTVQVGAFRSAEQARALAARLLQRGYEAYVVTVDLGAQGGQGIWHRVRIGRFAERQPAVELATRVAATERVPAQVLREAAPAP